MFKLMKRRRLQRSLTAAQHEAVEQYRSAYREMDEENRRSRRSDDSVALLLSSAHPAAASGMISDALRRLEPLEAALEGARQLCYKQGLTNRQMKLLVGDGWLPPDE